MANPGPGNSVTLRVEAPASFTATSELASAAAAGAVITALDVVESHAAGMVVDLNCNTTGSEHAEQVRCAIDGLDGVLVRDMSDRT